MEGLIEELSTVNENYSNDIREFERFFNRLLGKHKYPFQLQEKGDKVTQIHGQLQPNLNRSEEDVALGWKIDSSTQSEHEDDEPLSEKLTEIQSDLKQAKVIIKSLESASELENTTHRKIEEELEKNKSQITKLCEKLKQVQIQLKESKERIKFLEEESATEKLTLTKTKESLENGKVQIKTEDNSQTDGQVMVKLKEKIKCLENSYRLEKSAHQKTSEDLEKAKIQVKAQDEKNIQIQVQLTESKKTIKCLESHFLTEKSAHEQTRELLEKANHQNKAQDEKNTQMQITIKQFKEKMDRSESDASADTSAHKRTKEALDAAKSQGWPVTEGRKKRASEKERSMEIHLSDYTKELKRVIEELQDQLQHTKTEKSSLQDNYEKEKASHQNTKEELEQANHQIKVLTEKCEGPWVEDASVTKPEDRVQQLQEREDQLSEQVLQLQNSVERFREDLLVCTSVIDEPKLLQEAVIALKMCHLNDDIEVNVKDIFEEKYKLEINDLRTKIENCAALLDASLSTNSKLEEKLSSVDDVYAKRERNYVKLINTYVVKAHSLQTKLSTHISKCKKPLQHRVCSWFNQNVLRSPTDASHDNEEPPDLYPDDWRLPGIPDLRWKRKFSSQQ